MDGHEVDGWLDRLTDTRTTNVTPQYPTTVMWEGIKSNKTVLSRLQMLAGNF